MEISGYLAALVIGISLGLTGGGGSILTVPVLVYLFGVPPLLATSYSLFIVGSTSLVGAIGNYHKGFVSLKTALWFGFSSIITVFLTRRFLLPALPYRLATIGSFTLTKPFVTMMLFALLMLGASISMIRGTEDAMSPGTKGRLQHLKLFLCGMLIGFVTGLLGAGGGFLLVPALVLLVHLPMKKAIGTSLLIIALNSLIGFTGDLGHFAIDWSFLLTVSAVAVGGIFIGGLIGKKLSGEKLKKGFGWFVLLMGLFIIIRELA